jgi:ATP/maltotriose-dependent transcriptional regulator MalT
LKHAAEANLPEVNFFGIVHPIVPLVPLSRVLWLRRFSEQALGTARKALDKAASQDNPVPLANALIHCSTVYVATGDLAKAEELIERAIVHAGQHSLAPYRSVSNLLRGEVAVMRNEPELGLDLLKKGMDFLSSVQHDVDLIFFTHTLAEALRRTGRSEEAILTVNEGLTRAEKTGQKFYVAELLRIKSGILVSAPRPDREAAMDCLKQAIAVAREQSACLRIAVGYGVGRAAGGERASQRGASDRQRGL